MIDPYARANERIRGKRRAQGRRADEHDALIRAASQELGAVTEAMLGVFVDFVEGVGLRYLEEAARSAAPGRQSSWAPDVVRAMRFASSRLPGASGRAVSNSSDLVFRGLMSVAQEMRRQLESTRRGRSAKSEQPPRKPPRRPDIRSAATDPSSRRPTPRPSTPRRQPSRRPSDRSVTEDR